MNETVLVIGTLVVMLIGVVGAFLPVIPDVAIIWLAGLLGMILVEYRRHRNWKRAVASATGAAAGCGLSYVVKVGLSLVMVAMWAGWVWLANVR